MRAATNGYRREHAIRAMRTGRRCGLFEVEVLTSIAVITVLMSVLALTSHAYVQARRAYVLERNMRMAAQAQLDRYRAGFPLSAPLPQAVQPANVTLKTEIAPGQGEWTGMTKVTVTASGTDMRGNSKHITLAGYFREAPSP